MKHISAHNRSSLLAKLAEMDITVPPRGTERKTEHTERWIICRLLSTLAWERKLSYPNVVEKSERPDYILRVNNDIVGIEITEAVKEDLARAHALPESERNGVIDISLFKWRDQKKTLDELRDIVGKDKLTGQGWSGDAPAQEFADAISDIAERKTLKLNEGTFSRYSEDWLLIYENLSLPGLNRSVASSYLCLSLADYWSSDSFSRIFVESGEYIIEVSSGYLHMHRLCMLW